ncbi:glycosyltransferase family 9 protein [Candidatus Latescibacterota bacterium]
MDILVIRFSSLGDVVMATAVVETLHREIHEPRIHILTKKEYVQVFEGDRRIEKIVTIDGHEKPFEILKKLGRRNFDAVIDLHSSIRSRAVGIFLHSPLKMRIKKHSLIRRIMILTHNRFRRRFDVLGSYLDTLKPLGINERVLPHLMLSEKARTVADKFLSGFEKIALGFAPGAKHTTKRWNEDSYAYLADEAARQGYFPVFIGDKSETAVVDRIRKRMSEESISIAGEVNLAETCVVISRLCGLVTNDSGMMHIAGALSTPFVAIFGPTHPDLGFVPGYPSGIIMHSGADCSPCSVHGQTPCRLKQRVCMDDITWEMVMSELQHVVNIRI